MEGYGVYKWRNGNVYDGYWKQNKKDGQGKMTFLEEEKVYEGQWKEGYKHGKGKLIDDLNDY